MISSAARMTAVDSTSSWNCWTDVSVSDGGAGGLPVLVWVGVSSRATANMFSSLLIRVVERAVIRATMQSEYSMALLAGAQGLGEL